MDLHALSQGRNMLIVRGCIAFVVGAIASNQAGISAGGLALLWGLWALAEGAATLRQAYPRSGTSARAEAQPVLLVLGGVAVAVGVLVVVFSGISAGTLTWLLAGWFGVRAVFEGLGAAAARGLPRALLGVAALFDVALVAVFATHTSGNTADLALFGGGVAMLWSLTYLILGMSAAPVIVVTPEGPRLLAPR